MNGARLSEALQVADAEHNLRAAARIFRNEIENVLRIEEDKQQLSKGSWVRNVGEFLAKLYPLARLSLQVTGALAQVTSNFLNIYPDNKGSKFHTCERRCRYAANNFAGSSLYRLCRNSDIRLPITKAPAGMISFFS